MIDIWDWENENQVEIIDLTGKVFRGNVIEVSTAEDDGTKEETIALETNKGIIGFMPSEIQTIQHY